MQLNARPARKADFVECLLLLNDRHAYDACLLERLPALWGEMLDGSGSSGVVEDLDRPDGRRILYFGISAFVTPEYADAVRGQFRPHIGLHVLRQWAEGRSPILNLRQVRDANSSIGLHLAVPWCGCDPAILSNEEQFRRITWLSWEVFRERHIGYRLNEITFEAPAGLMAQFLEDGGWRYLPAPFDHSVGDNACSMPVTFRFTSADSVAMPGCAASEFFKYAPPRICFSQGEQEMLRHAMDGETDVELAASLHITLAAIKKRWASVYDRVAGSVVGIIGNDIEATPGQTGRGAEKRRRLLGYLVDHREELRPVNPGLLKRGEWRRPAILHAAKPRVGSLPQPITAFIGRGAELAEIGRRLAANRLVTLTGPGGIGKTRLAIHVAASHSTPFAGEVYFVDLSYIAQHEFVTQSIAAALGAQEEFGSTLRETLARKLERRDLLLVLDNCELLLTSCADVARLLLERCSEVRILVTSRQPLGITGEIVWKVSPMTIPPSPTSTGKPYSAADLSHFDSVRLFVERAGAIRPGFALSDSNAARVAEICRHVDGIPLALELAAGRLTALSVDQVAARLDDCMRLLTGGDSTRAERGRTMRGALDVSYAPMPRAARALFRRLSLFSGGWTLEAAEEICSDNSVPVAEISDLLETLVRNSLVGFEETSCGGRYGMLETLRQFAIEKLREDEEVADLRRRHARWFLKFGEDSAQHMQGPEESKRLSTLERENQNLRLAFDSFIAEGDGDSEMRLAIALRWFWMVRGYSSEGRARFAGALSRNSTGKFSSMRADALNGAGVLAWNQSDYRAARGHFEDAIYVARNLDDVRRIGRDMHNLGGIAILQGDYTLGETCLNESLYIARESANRTLEATNLVLLGNLHRDKGDNKKAMSFYKEGVEIHRALSDRFGMAESLICLAALARERGDYSEAYALLEESIAIGGELGGEASIAAARMNLGLTALEEGDLNRASQLLWQSLASLHNRGARQSMTECLDGLARLAAARSAFSRSVQITAATQSLRAALGAPLPPAKTEQFECHLAHLRAAFCDEEFNTAWEEGCNMPLDRIVELAAAE
jgi:predicted ATPase